MHCMRGLARLPVAGVLVPAVASRSRANAAMQPQQRGVASAARQRNVYIVPRDGGQPRKLCSARRAAHGASAVPLVAQQQRVARFAGLTPDDFRHPLDQQNTSFVSALPGMELIAKTLMGPVAEQVLLLENIATSIKTGPEQLPTVHNLLLEAASVLQMEPPELYVRQNPTPNAYTLAISGHKPFIVVHTSLLELLSERELQAVLAHELGHLKCDHGLWLTVANVLASGTVTVLPIISGTVEDALLRWLRAAELTCDRAALLVAQDPAVVIGALMKLAGGSPTYAHELSVEAFLEQARSYDEVTTSSMLGWYLRNAQTRALSHPLPVMRAREIDRWAHGQQYRALLARNAAHAAPTSSSASSAASSSVSAQPVQPTMVPAPVGAAAAVNGGVTSSSTAVGGVSGSSSASAAVANASAAAASSSSSSSSNSSSATITQVPTKAVGSSGSSNSSART